MKRHITKSYQHTKETFHDRKSWVPNKRKKINSIVAFYCNQIYINVKFKGCAESADCNL